ncbi:MAG: NAD(P) transhydrogenase subunit alpha [Rhodospirillales bacterium]|jgi:NAD(P) transhydrogenase subunit alpha|nr:NAD(P) transhydrogenase subunit alpha [Rhodospirillales bacterium]
MTPQQLADEAHRLAAQAQALGAHAQALAAHASHWAGHAVMAHATGGAIGGVPFIYLFSIFVMACFVGYYVVWNVTPALHSPLLAVTNAISSVIVVGAILAAGIGVTGWSRAFGFLAVLLASVNIFGGFFITHRMLSMFRRKQG